MTNEELVARIKNGERNLTLTLWEQVRKLVIKITRRYLLFDGSNVIEQDDLIQAGFIGMLRAIQDFDSTAGFSFTAFLDKHVRNAGRGVIGIRNKKQDPLISALSLDKPIVSESELALVDAISDPSQAFTYDDLLEELDRREETRVILAQAERLDPFEREVFGERYVQGLSLKRISEIHDMDTQKVNFLINKLTSRIRNTGPVRLLWQRRVDNATRFYATKGLKGFKTSFSSVVEDAVIDRERLKQRVTEWIVSELNL